MASFSTCLGGVRGGGKCVEQVQCGILAFLQGNCALFGPQWVAFGILALSQKGVSVEGCRRQSRTCLLLIYLS